MTSRIFMMVFVAGLFFPVTEALPTGTFTITDEFVAYLKEASNPDRFGLRGDGRFYPYSPPEGRRIAFRQRIPDKKLYRTGWLPEEAEKAMREDIAKTAEQLQARLPQRYGIRFEEIPREGQEILVDFAFTEGIGNLRERLVRAAAALDWAELLDPAVYVRYEADWPNTYRNRAFMRRWERTP